MKAFVEYVANALADHPDRIVVSELSGKRTVVVELQCDAEDLGRLIGRDGKTIGAVRMLVSNLAAKQGRRAVVEVVE